MPLYGLLWYVTCISVSMDKPASGFTEVKRMGSCPCYEHSRMIHRFIVRMDWNKLADTTLRMRKFHRPWNRKENLWQLGNFACFVICWFFSKLTFRKHFQEYLQSAIQLGSRSGRHFVGPDLGLNCWQKLSAYNSYGKISMNEPAHKI